MFISARGANTYLASGSTMSPARVHIRNTPKRPKAAYKPASFYSAANVFQIGSISAQTVSNLQFKRAELCARDVCWTRANWKMTWGLE